MKKTWETPQLIILVRSKPEETLLQVCKDGTPNGPTATNGICSTDCMDYCNAYSAS